jgi:hypothetical protein
MLICSICSEPYAWHRACDQHHQGVCHPCACLNLSGNRLESEPHPAPRETPVSLTAAARRVLGAVPEARYPWLEEDMP